ncbi:MAG TPA: site-2 protease family protein [Vicinamibacteria bacterium]|nr:site-2 protease family protein [Vicinamibacteria bacterium]
MSSGRCPDCGTQLSSTRLSCPVCNRLVHREELERIAAAAGAAREKGEAREEIVLWRRALELLPPETAQSRTIAERVSELSPIVESEPEETEEKKHAALKWAGVGGVALLAWKLKSVLAFLITKGKFLLAGLTKSGTFFSMLLSLGVYWTAFGWQFALGLVVSIYIHEMGHVAALHRLGIRASAPMFLPGIGAVVRMEQYPVDAREDARVGLAGPLWGLGAAVVAYVVFLATAAPIWGAIARVGAWINLFNLLPVWQLDGGRGFRALARSERYVVTALLLGLWLYAGEGLLVLLVLAAAFRTWTTEPSPNGDRMALGQFVVLLVALTALSVLDVPV